MLRAFVAQIQRDRGEAAQAARDGHLDSCITPLVFTGPLAVSSGM
jgi:hypothetical protein